jgi:transposase-like protein
VGTIGLKIPRLRHGSYFPKSLLEPGRRAEKALTAVVAEAYPLGVSTRRVEDLVERRWDREDAQEPTLAADQGARRW